jgi:hypothetical protein
MQNDTPPNPAPTPPVAEPEKAEIKPPVKINWRRQINAFQRFAGTAHLIHTSKGYIDPNDRQQRGMIDG